MSGPSGSGTPKSQSGPGTTTNNPPKFMYVAARPSTPAQVENHFSIPIQLFILTFYFLIKQTSASQVKLVPGQNKPNVVTSNQGKYVVVQSAGSGQVVRVYILLFNFLPFLIRFELIFSNIERWNAFN